MTIDNEFKTRLTRIATAIRKLNDLMNQLDKHQLKKVRVTSSGNFLRLVDKEDYYEQ